MASDHIYADGNKLWNCALGLLCAKIKRKKDSIGKILRLFLSHFISIIDCSPLNIAGHNYDKYNFEKKKNDCAL